MGCSSSKSTPTVEEQIPSSGDIRENIMKNGKAMFTGVENKLDEMKDSVMDTGAKIEAALMNSPATQRAGNLDNECTESNIAVDGSETTDLNVERADEDCDGLQSTDKPSTPMPEICLVSEVTFNRNDGSESCTSENQGGCEDTCDANCSSENQSQCDDICDASCTSERSECENICDDDCNSDKQSVCEDICDDTCTSDNRSTYGGNCGTFASTRRSTCGGNGDTLNSNIFKAVCNTAADVAMQDTDTEDCSQSIIYCNDSSRTSTLASSCSQNSMKTNCQLSGRSTPESNCEFDSYYDRRRCSTGGSSSRTICEQNDTYTGLGRQRCGCSATTNRNNTCSFNGNMQLKGNTKSISRTLKFQ